jgi:hypothetical protein
MNKINTVILDLLTPTILLGLIYYQSSLIWYALLVSWVVCNCTTLIVHEGWAHQYIVPKNKYFGYILDILGYFVSTPIPIEKYSIKMSWKIMHQFHHKYWKESNDFDQKTIDNTHWLIYLFFPAHSTHTTNALIYDKFYRKQTKEIYAKMSNTSIFIDVHRNKILFLMHIIFLLLLGLENYFYFVLFPVYMYSLYHKFFGEVLAHKNKLTKNDDKDYPYLFFICTSLAFHNSHHRYIGINLGSNWQKYLNIQFYFVKLFYNVKI